jgi:hypothetical protein
MPGRNALVLETHDPWEFVGLFEDLRANPARERSLRQHGQRTARYYAWPQIIRQVLLPRLQLSTHARYAFEDVQEPGTIRQGMRLRALDEPVRQLINVTPASFAWLRRLIDKRDSAKAMAPSIMGGIGS